VPGLLPAERALLGERAAARRVWEFALGRGCAHAALAALAPARAAELAATPIGRDGERCPHWPPGFVGAITHHRGQAAAAVARAGAYRGLGLDLEALRPPSPGLLRRILRPEERARWEALPAALPLAERTAAFIRIFSAKESVYKALYPHTRVYLGFQDAEIELDEPAAGGGDGSEARALRWRLHKACGPGLPVSFTGPGRVLQRGDFVLSAVWLER
jgi:4'-phosphopantetheinyl transferase EntD